MKIITLPCITMSLSLAIYCLKLSLTILLLKGSSKMFFKEETLQYRISGHVIFFTARKVLEGTPHLEGHVARPRSQIRY